MFKMFRSVPADVAKGWEDLPSEWNTTLKVSWLIIEDWIDLIFLYSTFVCTMYTNWVQNKVFALHLPPVKNTGRLTAIGNASN